jgi:hypothetical protein
VDEWTWRVRARAHRCLVALRQYRDLTPAESTAPQWLANRPLLVGEEWIGVYENIPGSPEDCVGVTNRGLHIWRGLEPDFLAYEELDSTTSEGLIPKRKADQITVRLRDGQLAVIPIRGGDDRSRDLFEFLRFLQRVMSLRTAETIVSGRGAA